MFTKITPYPDLVGGPYGNRTRLFSCLQNKWPPLAVPKPIYYLENFIKRTLPVFIPYSYNGAHHSVTVTISLSPRAVALKLLTASPKTPSTEGNLSTPNFHPSFRIWIIKYLLFKQTKSEPWATRTTIGFPLHFWKGYRLNPIVLHSLYLLTSCGRGLQGSSHLGVYCWGNQFRCTIASVVPVPLLLHWWLVYHLPISPFGSTVAPALRYPSDENETVP